MVFQDIILDQNLEPQITSGDFTVDVSEWQHIEHIMRASPGHYREYPLCGASVHEMKNGPINGVVRAGVRRQLIADGYQVNRLIMSENEFSIDVTR